MNFRKVNNITGLVVGVIACAVYILSREAAGSFWDCGEFVACCYKVQMPHPPGAPMFVLLGRLFIILFGDNPAHAAHAVNLMSAMASGLTILFLFWTITHFARKMFVTVGEEMNGNQLFTVMAAGVVGAMIYCFSDSFWFSGVEGEVYALSSFFTALVFWAMLKWEHADERAAGDPALQARADRWIIFIFFMMGLSIGVHLLNLLTIPAMTMIYYFRRYKYKLWGAIGTFVISCVLTWMVLIVFIQYSIKAAGIFDVYAVNNFHLGFFTGFIFYFAVIALLIIVGLRFKEGKVNKTQLSLWLGAMFIMFFYAFIAKGESTAGSVFKFLLVGGLGFVAYLFKPGSLKAVKLVLWCYAFIQIGFSTYFTTLIRSNADPAIDMYNVDNPMSLAGLLGREQYGEPPMVYGPHYMATPKEDENNPGYYAFKKSDMKYVKGKNKYIPIGRERSYIYKDEDMQLFPRVWDGTDEQGHRQFYADWLDLAERDQQGNVTAYDPPTYGDNMKYFFTYQLGLMYWRYFMWNFAGKQNDLQGSGNVRDGNWLTGIPIIDNQMLGDQSKMPASSTNNKAHNKLYLLPFVIGILGCVYQFSRDRRDWIVNFLLFFMTGIAIDIYLNMPGLQPRERDYAFVGSFYVFAVWGGLAIPAIVRLVREKENKKLFNNVLVLGSILTFLIAIMSEGWLSKQSFITVALMITAVYAIFAAAVVYGIRAISNAGKNVKLAAIVASVICAIAPIVMANQEWDDHDRSTKRLAPDAAKDYLESCAQNAILFTFGDNDTYPLWYAQEVEGVRPDIRIINNSLLGIDWYINQFRYKVNESAPIDLIWTPEQIEGHNRDALAYQPDPAKPQDRYYSLYDVMKNDMGRSEIDPETGRDTGPQTFGEKRFSVPVDTTLVRRNGTVNAKDSVVSQLQFELPLQPGRYIQKNDLAILNIIAANNWKRPIYFTSYYPNLGFQDYLRKDGMTYRLVPIKTQRPQDKWVLSHYVSFLLKDVNLDSATSNVMNKFAFGSSKGTYFDEENRRHALNIRSTFAEVAGDLAEANRKDDALKMLKKCESMINSQDLPYAMVSRDNSHNLYGLLYLEAAYKAGDKELAQKVDQALKKDLQQQRGYYNYLRDQREDLYTNLDAESHNNDIMLMILDDIDKNYAAKPQTNTNVPAVEGKNSTIISNGKDTGKKKDSGKK